MQQSGIIKGFSKLSRREKLTWLRKQVDLSDQTLELLDIHLHTDPQLQEIYEDISENTVSNYFLPMGLAPNFLINDELLTVPMVTEESSVVAAASHAARFWAISGGFHTEVTGTRKVGQVHFTWSGSEEGLRSAFNHIRAKLVQSVKPITGRMEQRGGGVDDVVIKTGGPGLPGSYHLLVTFQTANAMGANFINSVLEAMAGNFTSMLDETGLDGEVEIIMSILSNYTPECLATCHVEADTAIFNQLSHMTGDKFAHKFKLAVDIAEHDTRRAVTHNKGIFNGMDAVIMATGNDFRAVEACGHAYASKSGRYGSLSRVELSGNIFRFSLEVPMAVGTVGGLTGTHPLAGASLDILGNPSAEKLMQVIAAAGMATNFSAVRSLITTGIQHGHMKMHLGNILRQLKASSRETSEATSHFRNRAVSYQKVVSFLNSIRDQNERK